MAEKNIYDKVTDRVAEDYIARRRESFKTDAIPGGMEEVSKEEARRRVDAGTASPETVLDPVSDQDWLKRIKEARGET